MRGRGEIAITTPDARPRMRPRKQRGRRAPRETKMSDAFHDRENTFEKQFANDEALRFRAIARRNKAVALWVAEAVGLKGGEAAKYAEDFVGHGIGKTDDEIVAALKKDLARAAVEISDHRLHKKMNEEMATALAAVRAGK